MSCLISFIFTNAVETNAFGVWSRPCNINLKATRLKTRIFAMFHIVIAGIIDDEVFHHVATVARYMSKHLPHFNVQQIFKRREHWDEWIKKISKEKGWYHRTSPIIWKEIGMSGGKAVLLGGANEFWEYIREYYGVTSILESRDKPLLLLDSLKQCIKQEKPLSRNQDTVQITVIGAAHPMASLLVMDLLHSVELARNGSLKIHLYDHIAFIRILEQLEWDSCALGSAAGFASVRVIQKLEDALCDSNTIIILQHKDYCRHEGQSLMDWLSYNYNFMLEIAGAINANAPEDCRIILAGAGTLPLCFNVNVIAEFATQIQAHNIVAVTADLALEAIRTTALSVGLSSGSVAQPTIWGCIGLNNLVDVRNATHALEISTRTSKLGSVKGSVFLRHISYLLENENKIYSSIQKEKNHTEQLLDRFLYIAKVKATVDLLRHWYGIKNSRAILSLGIISDGSFGIPLGLCFSQPVQLTDGCWRPYRAQNLSKEFKIQLRSLLYFPCQIMKQFNLGGRFESKWFLTSNERKKIAQLNQIQRTGVKQKENQKDLVNMSALEEVKKNDQKEYVRSMLSEINNIIKQEKESRQMKKRELIEANMIGEEGIQITAKATYEREMKEIL